MINYLKAWNFPSKLIISHELSKNGKKLLAWEETLTNEQGRLNTCLFNFVACTSLEGWVATYKLIARPLATEALWVLIWTSLKNHNG